MFRPLALATTILIGSAAAGLAADRIAKTSPHSVSETMDRLEAAVTGAGATVFARIDHSAGAQSVGLELPPAEVLIFGNPKLGTPAMQDGLTAGLDLPLRVLAYADAQGRVQVIYHAPADLAAAHGLPEGAKYIQMMTGALDKLTGKAVASD